MMLTPFGEVYAHAREPSPGDDHHLLERDVFCSLPRCWREYFLGFDMRRSGTFGDNHISNDTLTVVRR